MKTYLFAVLLLTGLSSCHKNKETNTSGTNTIIGSWNIVLITGGFAGLHETQARWGHTKTVVFRSDNTFTITTDAIATTGTYTHSVRVLYLSDSVDLAYNFAHDTLTLSNNAISDATTEWYVRR